MIGPTIRPLVKYGKDGVYAVDSVKHWDCPTGKECESGGGYEQWMAMGRLSDLAEGIPDRPLYAKVDWETGQWVRVDPPAGSKG